MSTILIKITIGLITLTSIFFTNIGQLSTAEYIHREEEIIKEPIIKECFSCVEFVRRYIPDLPIIESPADLNPNSTPCIDCAILMDYNGVPHIAYSVKISSDGVFFEDCNREVPHKKSEGFILWDAKEFRGFYTTQDIE